MQIITLTTDIGQQDYIVAAMKGQLLSCAENITVVDVCHYLSQSNFPEAAYICNNAFKYFPQKTIHIICLNFFEKRSENILFIEYNNQIVICADNGLITMMADEKPIKVYKLPYNFNHSFLEITLTIAKTITKILQSSISNVLELCNSYIVKLPLKPTATEESIKGHIIFIDNFENVVVNITQNLFEQYRKGRNFSIILKRNEEITSFSHNYLSVRDGEKLAWFNSAGYLEIAVNKGNMAGLFGLQGFNELNYKEGKSLQNKLFFSSVTIFFR